MYRLTSVLLAFGLSFGATVFAADETVTVTGSKETPGQSPGLFGGGPSSGGQPSVAGKPCPPDGGVDCGGGGSGGKFQPITSAQILVLVMEQWGEMVNLAASKEVYGELEIIVTTKEGTRVEVRLKVGFGSKEVISSKKK